MKDAHRHSGGFHNQFGPFGEVFRWSGFVVVTPLWIRTIDQLLHVEMVDAKSISSTPLIHHGAGSCALDRGKTPEG